MAMDFDLLKEEFLSYLRIELNRSELTVKGYRKDLNVFQRYLKKSFQKEKVEITEITTNFISSYLQHLATDLQHRPTTMRRHLATLKSFFNFAVLHEYLVKNPAEDITAPRIPQRQPAYLEKKQVEALFRTITPDTPLALRDLTMLKTLFYSGIRVRELVGLKRQHLDFQEKIIKIVKGKGEKQRSIPLHPELEKQLEIYLKEGPSCQDDYLFCNYRGEGLTTEFIRQLISRCAQTAGFKQKVTPHILRHSFATILYKDCGVDLKRLAELLGHSSIRHTVVYAHSDVKHLKEAVEILPAPGEEGIRVRYPLPGKGAAWQVLEEPLDTKIAQEQNILTGSKSLELQEALNRYLDYVRYVQNFSKTTYIGKKHILQRLVSYLKETVFPGQTILLKDIKTAHLRHFLQFLHTEKKYKPATLYTNVVQIKTFFKYAFQHGFIDRNPAAKLVNPRIPPREIQYFKWDEVQLLFNNLEPENSYYLRDQAIVKTLYYTGIRAQELCDLKTEDLDPAFSILTIVSGKGDKWRLIPLHSHLQETLRLYMKEGRDHPDSPYLFASPPGKKIYPGTLHKIFRKLKEKTAITGKRVSPHTLRHTFATHLYQGGVDLRRIALLLGHANLNHTEKYTHTSQEHLREAIELL